VLRVTVVRILNVNLKLLSIAINGIHQMELLASGLRLTVPEQTREAALVKKNPDLPKGGLLVLVHLKNLF